MNTHETQDLEIATEAAAWVLRLKSDGAGERSAFASWLRQSPLHVKHFLRMTVLEKELEEFVPERPLAAPTETHAKVVPFVSQHGPTIAKAAPQTFSFALGRGKTLAIAACLLAAVGIASTFVMVKGEAPQQYITFVGERRDVSLTDGSLIQVNAASELQVDYSRSARNVRLVRGEAVFTVAHDVSRPFQVRVGNAVVRAVGTAFNVDKHDSRTSVAVLEGRVQITSAGRQTVVSAGEIAEIGADGHLEQAKKGDVDSAVAWRDGSLVFQDETLAEIAEEFNRYNRVPRLIIEGEAPRRMTFSGSFRGTNPESLLQYLSHDPSLIVEPRGNAVVIRERVAPVGARN